jgi:hypothetical protein
VVAVEVTVAALSGITAGVTAIAAYAQAQAQAEESERARRSLDRAQLEDPSQEELARQDPLQYLDRAVGEVLVFDYASDDEVHDQVDQMIAEIERVSGRV